MGDADPFLGRTLGGRFRVTGFIGEGAMANVYRGAQDASPQDVALKIMHPHLATDRTFVGRFKREARAAAQLNHPNTVRIIDTGVDDGILFIAMELLRGRDLFEVLVVEKRLSERRAVEILVQICQALGAAHEKGIIHRDLKPENIMLVEDEARPGEDVVKVLDFGIAKILEPELARSGDSEEPPSSVMNLALTNVGVVVGTPAYMSPEQCRGAAVDARSDIYSAGVLLYQLVTGRLPFSSKNSFELAALHVTAPPPRPSSLVPSLHPGLEAVILKALEKWPAQRHQTIDELRVALEMLVPALPFDASAPAPGPVLLRTGALDDAKPRTSTLDSSFEITRPGLHVLPPMADPAPADTLSSRVTLSPTMEPTNAPVAPAPIIAPLDEAPTQLRDSSALVAREAASLFEATPEPAAPVRGDVGRLPFLAGEPALALSGPASMKPASPPSSSLTWIAMGVILALALLGVVLTR